MLEIKRMEDKSQVAAIYVQEAAPYTDGCQAYGVFERGELCGYCLYRLAESVLIFGADAGTDLFLLDGLVRAVLSEGAGKGCQTADFSAIPTPKRESFEKLGFLQQEPLPIDWFLENCKKCKGWNG